MPSPEEMGSQEEERLLLEDVREGRELVRPASKVRRLAYVAPALCGLGLVLYLFLATHVSRNEGRQETRLQQKYAVPPIPQKVNQHNGIEWPALTVPGTEQMHFFIIGDWGGLDGYIDPPTGERMVMYQGGELPGPHVFAHRPSGCTDGEMSLCFNNHGVNGCLPQCGYNETVDREPQYLVAGQMKLRAKKTPPKFMLNVGDNFYWGGIPISCGAQPIAGVHWTTAHMFDTIFRQVYNSPELNTVVWLSVLGNHDYGGWMFTSGWDQQIAFTWHDQRWRLPAQFWKQHVSLPDQDFGIDILLLDSNSEDAVDPAARPTTNICGAQHNPPGANCASVGGPASLQDCPVYFAKLWQEQMAWAEKQLKASRARWQVIVTHFPCGHQPEWYSKLHAEFGLDFLVTGHTHVQEVYPIGGMLCVISGGGGGILSEAAPKGDNSNSYGFYDATINRTHLVVESINFLGRSLGNWTATPVDRAKPTPKPTTTKPTTPKPTAPAHAKAPAAHHASGKPPPSAPKHECGMWCQMLKR